MSVVVALLVCLSSSPSTLPPSSPAPASAAAVVAPPPGFRRHVDKLDGYSFFFPEDWIVVTTSGNDVFYRNPRNLDENLFVEVSSPSSSRFKSVEDLGSPEEAADRYLRQYLEEFMSTRLGVKRVGRVISAARRTGGDGQLYYDLDIQLQSYATRQQLAITQEERVQELEWDRRLLTTLGTANKRLYEMRVQTGTAKIDESRPKIREIQESFRCRELDV
jgi:hypothetical protein